MGQARNWKPEEEEYLRNHWGEVSVAGLCKHLKRSKNAIIVKVNRLGLPPFYESGDYVTLNQVYRAIRGKNVGKYQKKSWEQNRGLPVHNKKRGDYSARVVYLDEFWEWAEKNRSFIDFSKMEPLALGIEPDWVAEQRSKDYKACAIQRKDPWTSADDSRLIMLLKKHKYGYAELSEMLQRSSGAIQRRCADLGLKERPVKADNHGAAGSWSSSDYERVADGIRNGDSYTVIGKAIGKSEKAVRGKVYYEYLTEQADKVRQMLGDGKWGDGTPVPTVKQGVHLSKTRTEVKQNLSAIAGILRFRMNELGYDPFWQRFMCMNWDDNLGCKATCTDCDECTEFVRIKPQYCARCGGTFYERSENRFCGPCRIARKKRAQRHYCRAMAVNK